MRILFDNVNFSSRSGPNNFGRKMAIALSARGHVLAEKHEQPEAQLSFIDMTGKHAPRVVLRLDGIWFNSAQDWRSMNAPIQRSYQRADAVIVQSEFDRRLIEKFFGHREMSVIHNGTDVELVQSRDLLDVPSLRHVERVWSCASSWRPHKRLGENIRYFQEHAGPKDCLVVAGANPDVIIPSNKDPRIFYAGDLNYLTLLSLFKSSDYFIHLSWLDHCPNVVVDARAAGSHIICSSSGGTREVAGHNSTIVEEDLWDFEPVELYRPPPLDFTRTTSNVDLVESTLDIAETARAYENVLGAK